MQEPEISYREVSQADLVFLRSLRETTMREVVEQHRPWVESEQEQRLLTAMENGLIIRSADADIGLLKVVRCHNHVELMQLQLEPAWQGKGIGSRIVQDLQAECAAAGLPLVLHVYASSRAARLFERLGFYEVVSTGQFRGLRWSVGDTGEE